MLLVEEVANAFTGPIRAETGFTWWIENGNALIYGFDDRFLWFLESIRVNPYNSRTVMTPTISDFDQILSSCYIYQENKKCQILGPNYLSFPSYGRSKFGPNYPNFAGRPPSWILRSCLMVNIFATVWPIFLKIGTWPILGFNVKMSIFPV